ncbi:MAG: ABC transporter substrate-binding protein [Candidatus Xenobia bacterium]
MRRHLWLYGLLLVLLAGCSHRAEKGVFYTAGNWLPPPGYQGNFFAPGGNMVDAPYVYEPLFVYLPRSGKFIGRLGDRFEESGDHKLLTVHLRHPVYWHDGSKFSSRDVLCTWNMAWLTGQNVYDDLDHIECPDDDTVVFHWRRPSVANKLNALCTRWITASRSVFGRWADQVPDLLAEEGRLSKDQLVAFNARLKPIREQIFSFHPARPVGTGPFRVVRVSASDIILDRFPQHYDAATLQVKQMHIQAWGSNDVIWSYLLAGQVDAVSPACPLDVVQEILGGVPGTHMVTPSDMSDFGLVFNCTRPPMANVHFRRAIAWLLDRDMVRQLAYYYGTTSDGYTLGIPSAFRARWLDTQPPTHYTCNKPEAERELKLSGYDHSPLRLMAPAGSNDEVLLAEAAAAQLSRFGIPVEIVAVMPDLYASRLASQDYDLAAIDGVQMAALADPSVAFSRFFDEGGQIQQACGLPRIFQRDGRRIDTAALQTELAHTVDPARQRQIDGDLAWVINEQVPYVACYEKNLMIFVRDGTRVAGWPDAHDEIWDAAPGGVEMLFATLLAKGFVRPAP